MTEKIRKLGFLAIGGGGAGHLALEHIRFRHNGDGQPFPLYTGLIDTDPQPSAGADANCLITLTPEVLSGIKNSPQSFGPITEIVRRHFPEFLIESDAEHGSRTFRIMTQLAFEYYEPMIVHWLRQCVLDFAKQGGFDYIQPVLISSTGGGAGGAIQLLLARMLQNHSVSSQVTEGLPPNFVRTQPISFVLEPFAHALRHEDHHADIIMSNSFAWRIESAMLEDCFAYIFHIGLANTGGAVLDSIEECGKVLGLSAYEFMKNYNFIKARFVDTVDRHKLRGRYSGHDTPEELLPTAVHPSYASKIRPFAPVAKTAPMEATNDQAPSRGNGKCAVGGNGGDVTNNDVDSTMVSIPSDGRH